MGPYPECFGTCARKTIEYLWYGKIIPQDMCKDNKPRIDELRASMTRNRAEVTPTLSEKQKIILKKYDNNNEITSIIENHIFE